MLSSPNTSAWLISTDHDGGIMGMLERKSKEDTTMAYTFLRMTRICSDCAELENEKRMKCRHMCQWSPYFKSADKESKVKILYEAVGDLDTYQKELLSYMESGEYCFFNRTKVRGFLTNYFLVVISFPSLPHQKWIDLSKRNLSLKPLTYFLRFTMILKSKRSRMPPSLPPLTCFPRTTSRTTTTC